MTTRGFVLLLAVLVGCYAAALAPHHQQVVEDILDHAGDKTMTAIYGALDEVVKTMDAATQKDHATWKAAVKKETNQREADMKAILPQLSTEAAKRLIRIILVQQNPMMTQNEKRELLRRIQSDMDTDIRLELLDKLPEDTLFSLVV